MLVVFLSTPFDSIFLRFKFSTLQIDYKLYWCVYKSAIHFQCALYLLIAQLQRVHFKPPTNVALLSFDQRCTEAISNFSRLHDICQRDMAKDCIISLKHLRVGVPNRLGGWTIGVRLSPRDHTQIFVINGNSSFLQLVN